MRCEMSSMRCRVVVWRVRGRCMAQPNRNVPPSLSEPTKTVPTKLTSERHSPVPAAAPHLMHDEARGFRGAAVQTHSVLSRSTPKRIMFTPFYSRLLAVFEPQAESWTLRPHSQTWRMPKRVEPFARALRPSVVLSGRHLTILGLLVVFAPHEGSRPMRGFPGIRHRLLFRRRRMCTPCL